MASDTTIVIAMRQGGTCVIHSTFMGRLDSAYAALLDVHVPGEVAKLLAELRDQQRAATQSSLSGSSVTE